MRYCSSCGTLNDTDAKFCASCGKRLGVGLAQDEVTGSEDITRGAQPVQPENAAEIAEDAGAAFETTYIPVQVEPQVNTTDDYTYVSEPVEVTSVEAQPDHTIKGRVFGIIGFIINLEALICCWLPYVNLYALIMSIIGLIFCGISRKNTNFRLAKAGKTIGIIALIFSIITILLYVALIIFGLYYFGDDLAELMEQITNGTVNITIGY